MTSAPKIGLCVLLLFSVSGCIHRIAVNSLGSIMDTGFQVMNEEQDLGIADKSIASDLKLIETIIRDDPENNHYLLLATEGYASYTLGFVEDGGDLDRARMFYLRARDYGFRILDKNPRFAASRSGEIEGFRSSLASFSKDDVPAVFWTAISWGSMISISLTEPSALADLPKVEAMMRFVLAEDSTYFYGGAHFFLGTLDGSRAKMLGGDPDASRRHFEACLRINGGKFLMTYVYYARSYAVQTQDRELFERCLTTVDTTSINVLPEARLSNAIAKKKARLLREKIDQLF